VNIKTVRTTCGICQIGCGVKVYVDDGQIVKIEGDIEHPLNKGVLCPKGMASLEYLYHPDRLRRPLKREGKRGEGKWLPISWEEAIELISVNLTRVKEKYGPESITFIRGAAKGPQDEYLARFANIFGSPNFLSMGYVCFIPRRNASMFTYGFQAIPDIDYPPRSIIVWGENMSETLHHVYLRIQGAIRKGTRLIVVDPYKCKVADDAQLWIRLKPGADLALALGMLHVIIDESLYDRTFIENYTTGFDELREHVKDYTPHRVAEITWVPPETIIEAARLYAINRPSVIQWGNGIDHNKDNFQTARAICILRAITGNIGIPGGELQWQQPPILARGSATFSLYNMIAPEIRARRIVGEEKLLPTVFYALQQSVVEAMISGKPYPVKAAYIQGSNPLLSYPNAKKAYEAFQQVDFMAVSDIFMTPSAAIADVVLPVATYLEFDSISAPPYSLAVAAVQQQVTRIHDCHSDYEILRDLAEAMGMKGYFWDTEEECLDFILKPAGITFDEFRKIGILEGTKQYRNYQSKGFPTPSSKVELYAGRLKEMGFDPLPTWREPLEDYTGTGNINEEYPLILTSWKRIPYRHSGGRQIPSLRGMHQEPIVVIHPETAIRYKIADGERVCIETEQGKITQKALLKADIDPRVVGVDYGWWMPEERESTLFGWEKSNINVILDDKPPYSKEMGTPCLRGVMCRIYKSSV